jgi:hypothetical protein
VLKLCEVDKRNVYHLLPKVTKRHMEPSAQSAMKVNVASQVMSSTVAAAINTLLTAGKANCTVSITCKLINSGVVWCSSFPFICFYRILSHEGNVYHYSINCRLDAQQVSINSCVC